MINSVSRIMASNYRNNTKQNNTNFRGSNNLIFEDMIESTPAKKAKTGIKSRLSSLWSYLSGNDGITIPPSEIFGTFMPWMRH